MRSSVVMNSLFLALAVLLPPPLEAQNLPGGDPRDYRDRLRRGAAEYHREILHEVTSTFGRWKAAWTEDELGKIAGFYTSDAVVILPAQSAAYRGQNDVERLLEDLLSTLGEISTDIIEFDTGDRLAYLVAHFSAPPSLGIDGSGGMKGTCVSIFRLEGGDWKIRSQTFFERLEG